MDYENAARKVRVRYNREKDEYSIVVPRECLVGFVRADESRKAGADLDVFVYEFAETVALESLGKGYVDEIDFEE